MEVRKELYIDGRWTAPRSSGDIAVIDSRTEEVMGSVPRGAAPEVEHAVAAARSAFPVWAATPVADRVAALRAIADGLEARDDQLAELMSREVGTPIATSRRVQVGLAVDVFRSIADILEDFPLEERIGTSLLIRQPAGVVAAITPWNYPLYQLAAKLAPALARRLHRRSSSRPGQRRWPPSSWPRSSTSSACRRARSTCSAGPAARSATCSPGHPEVDMVSITGSTQAGISVAEAAARTVKRGHAGTRRQVGVPAAGRHRPRRRAAGRGAQLLRQQRPDLLGADPADRAARASSTRWRTAWPTSSGRCASATRWTPPPTSARWSARASATRCAATSSRAWPRAPRWSPAAPSAPDGLDRGFYVRPTVFSDVTPDMVIAREEIFGPVLVVHPGRRRRPRRADRQRLRLRAVRRGVVQRRGARRSPSPAGCAPARWRSTAGGSTSARRSAASSSPASVASSASTGWPSTSSSRRCNCRRRRARAG